MKLKSGKELSQLVIIKRLHLMGIKYDPSKLGKNYYIELYDKEIQSPENRAKIRQELEKDRIYSEFLCKKLQKSKILSFEISKEEKAKDNKEENKDLNNLSNKVEFFPDFNRSLLCGVTFCKAGIDTFDHIKENQELLEYIKQKFLLPIKDIGKNWLSKAGETFGPWIEKGLEVFEKIGIKFDNFDYIGIIIWVTLILVFILEARRFYRKRKENEEKK